LLSGQPARQSIPLYVSLVRYGQAPLVVAACEAAIAAGFQSFKLHETRLSEIEAGRAALGPERDMCVDVNCGWSVEFAGQNRGALEALDLTWLEEPVFPPEDYAALRSLRGKPCRVAAGENWTTARQCKEALAAGAVDILQPSITKVGGVSEYIQAIDAASASGVDVMPHSPYFGPGFFASIQVAAARPAVQALEYNFVRPDAWLADVEGLRHGDRIAVPETPGIGFEPDPLVLSRYRTA